MIYLVRHGETVWNTENRYQGTQNSALTQKGQSQARMVGELLARELREKGVLEEGKKICTQVSPLGRAQETAHLIALSVPVELETNPLLREISVGDWEGKTFEEIRRMDPTLGPIRSIFDLNFRSPSGEGFEQACERAKLWLQSVAHPVIAISHGALGRIIRGLYLGLSREDMLQLPTPQNGFYRLSNGQSDFIGEA